MTLHSRHRFNSWLPALFDGEFDWDFLLPAWKETKVQPMDFDAVIERRGNFLIFETKIPGKKMDIGQSITLTQQWRKGATIFLLSGKSPKDIEGMREYLSGKFTTSMHVGFDDEDRKVPALIPVCDYSDVLYRARCWFCWASGWKVPSREEWDNELWLWDYDRYDKANGKV